MTQGNTSRTDNVFVESAIQRCIYSASIYLDDERWDDWLALCVEDFHYAIKCFSPEINADMIYLQGSKKDMASLIRLLPKHNTDHSSLVRHTSVYTVDASDDGQTATAISSFVVYQTLLDGTNSHVDAGESHLFLIGKYYDTLRIEPDGSVRFLKRDVRIRERRLDKGSHWPI